MYPICQIASKNFFGNGIKPYFLDQLEEIEN